MGLFDPRIFFIPANPIFRKRLLALSASCLLEQRIRALEASLPSNVRPIATGKYQYHDLGKALVAFLRSWILRVPPV